MQSCMAESPRPGRLSNRPDARLGDSLSAQRKYLARTPRHGLEVIIDCS
jgi:hypothetical protein